MGIAATSPDVWVKADAITGLSDGQSITSWVDSSGNGRTFTQGTAAVAPVYKVNQSPTGKPSARFNGASQFMSSTAAAAAPAQTIMAVVRTNSLAATNTIRGSSPNGGLQLRLDGTTGVVRTLEQNVAGVGAANTPVAVGEWVVITTTFTSTTYAFRRNGAADGSGTHTRNINNGSISSLLGKHYDGVEFFSGDIGEIATWSRVLSQAEIDSCEAELLARWINPTASVADSVGVTDSASGVLTVPETGTVLPTMPRRAVLGSGKHQVFLYDRGGENRIGRLLGTTTVRWERQRDAISESTVILDPSVCRASALDSLQKGIGRYEIVIFRNGVRVWEGPITRTTWKSRSVEVTAHDVCHYLARTAMRNAYDNRYSAENSKVAPVTTRMEVILAHELARKEALVPPINVLPFLELRTNTDTATTSRFTPPYFSSVWEEMDHMGAKSGLDYTAVGRRILLNDVHDVIGRTPMLTDNDFLDDLIVTSYGMELATSSAVTDGEGRYAVVGGVDDFYGEVELIHTMYGEGVDFADPDNPTEAELDALAAELRSQAQRNLSGRYPIPTIVRVPDGTRLNPNAPVPIELLVPGVRVPIRTTRLRITLQQEQKLDYVKVEETKAGESVSVKLSPVPGSTPWDDSTDTSADEEDD